MASKIEEFKNAQWKLRRAEEYFLVFDVPGHMNQTGKVVEVAVSKFTVYHQAYAGATNYHEADEPLRAKIAEAVMGMGELIRRQVIAALKQEVAQAAKAAEAEAKAVLAEIQS